MSDQGKLESVFCNVRYRFWNPDKGAYECVAEPILCEVEVWK